jgi:hypothetical protein
MFAYTRFGDDDRPQEPVPTDMCRAMRVSFCRHAIASERERLHQKEHFVNYFLTCYVLPGNDLRPVG